MVTLHNLSAEPVKVRLPGDLEQADEGMRLRQVLGDTEPAYRAGEDVTLGRYGFRWLRRTE
jgi:hypothetical protein